MAWVIKYNQEYIRFINVRGNLFTITHEKPPLIFGSKAEAQFILDASPAYRSHPVHVKQLFTIEEIQDEHSTNSKA